MTMRVSTFSRRRWMPCSAWFDRRRPSKAKGRVTTPMVRAPRPLAVSAMTGRRAGAGAAALAGGDEDHVGALQHLLDLLEVLLGRHPPDLRVAAGAEPAGEVAPDVELDVRLAHQQRLGVGVDRHELDALQAGVDHAVDGVDPGAADTDHLDHGDEALAWVLIRAHPLLTRMGRSWSACDGLRVLMTSALSVPDGPPPDRRTYRWSATQTTPATSTPLRTDLVAGDLSHHP